VTERETLLGCLLRAAELGRETDGLRFVDRRENHTWHTWPDIAVGAAQMASGLRAAGVRSNDRVAIILPTCLHFVELFFACHHLGAVPVPLYPPVRLGRLDTYYERTTRMLERAGVEVLVTDARIHRILGPLLPRARQPLNILIAKTLRAAGGAAQAIGPCKAAPDDLALIQFSSGTTTAPKPVGLTHAQILCNAEAILDFMPENADYEHGGVSWLPLYHDMGLIGCIVPAVHRPGPLTLLPPEAFLARPALWLRAISRFKATSSPAPNFAFSLCNERITDAEMEGCDLSSWRLALNGAEPTSPTTMRNFIERFSRWGLRETAITPVYGLSEAALAVTFGDPNTRFHTQHFDKDALTDGRLVLNPKGVELASVGKPLRGFKVQIRDTESGLINEGAVGQIWVAGDSLTDGYVDGSDTPITDGWLQTGDLGFIHEAQLYITGRAKDVVVIRGKNHAPQTIEAAVDTVVGVRTGCAVAVADVGEHGEHLLVFVEYRKEGMSDKDFTERCRQAILNATGLNPDLVMALAPGTLPRTSSGKLRRAEALRRWHKDELTPPAAITPWLLTGALARSTWDRLTHRGHQTAKR
jgi:fatty-acyl-CoA synthase